MNNNLERTLRSLLYVVVIILLNVAAVTFFFRFDLTNNKIYTLADTSKNAVATLQEPLTIKAFFSRNMPSPYNAVEQQVRDLLEEYARWGNEFFNYSFYSMSVNAGADPNDIDEYVEEARSYRIFPIQIEKVERDEVNLVSAYMGLAFLYGDHLETIPVITSSERLEFTITEAIRDLNQRIFSLMGMEENIQVDLILSSDLNIVLPTLTEMASEVEKAVDRLNINFFDRLKFRHLDPSVDPSRVAEAEAYRLPPLFLGEDSEGNPRLGYAGIFISRGGEVFGQPLIQSSAMGTQIADIESIEILIESSANAILGFHEEVGYMVDFGPPPYRGITKQEELNRTNLSVFFPLVSPNYKIKGLFLEDRELPQGLNTLMIVSPREELTDWALFQIDQFLLRGGSLIMFLDPFDMYLQRDQMTNDPIGTPYFMPRETRMREFLEHYGIRLEQAYVLDEESFIVRDRDERGGVVELPVYYAPVIEKDGLNEELVFLNNLNGLITVRIAPLDLVNPEDPRASLLFSSSENAWAMDTEQIMVYGLNVGPPIIKKSYDLAYLMEGEFESFFMDREIPSRPIDESETEDTESEDDGRGDQVILSEERFLPEGRGRLFVMGTSSILGSNILDPAGDRENSLFLLNILDYMNDREGRAELRVKGGRISPIEEPTFQRRNFIKAFNIGILPALVAALGILLWLYWIARKKRIQILFQGSPTVGEVTQKEGSDS